MTSSSETKSTNIIFVRHGQAKTTGKILPGRAVGLHLTEKGKQQAKNVGERVASSEHEITNIYASPLERTQETANLIGEVINITPQTDQGLIEADFGDWTGKQLSELYKLEEWKQVQSFPSGFRFPNGESFSEMQLRIVKATQRLAAEHAGETIMLVSHADTIKAALAEFLGIHLDLFQRILLSPCSLSIIRYQTSGPLVVCVNNTDNFSTSG